LFLTENKNSFSKDYDLKIKIIYFFKPFFLYRESIEITGIDP